VESHVLVAETDTPSVPRAPDRTGDGSGVPLLEPARGGPAEWFAAAVGERHPVVAFLLAVTTGYLVLAAASVALGLLLTDVVLGAPGIERLDTRLPRWLAGERTETWTDLSWLGTEAAGGTVIPAAIGLAALAMALLRRYRVAAFVLFAVAVESATYRATTMFVERRRPGVERLESLPVDASYPSGHTAASIALYAGIALLVTSWLRLRGPRVVLLWAFVLAIPPAVALSRIYRGMHFPLDALAGALIGIAAIAVAVFACRVAGAAVARREEAGAR
jgi:membrane-associated phospholipid phosphatase